MNRAILAIIAVAILIVGATGYLLLTEKKETTVTLSSNGASLGKIPITSHGFADIGKM